jgi:hypothetical protein
MIFINNFHFDLQTAKKKEITRSRENIVFINNSIWLIYIVILRLALI